MVEKLFGRAMVGEQGKMGRGLMVRVVSISILAFVLSALGGVSSVWAQSVKAYVDRNPVMVDETFRLVVEAEGVSSSDAPNLKKLEENFALLGTSHSQQMSIVNMKTSSVKRWVTTLAPKRTGMFTIPSIQVGNYSSLPLSITVKEPSQVTGADSQRDIFLEAEVDSHVPVVQGQVLFTLRLVSAVPLQDGKLDDPEIEWGMVERVGKDSSYETIREGRRYQVTERRYILTPHKAGTQIIPPVLLSGSVPDERSQGSSLDQFFGNRRRSQSGDPFKSLFQTLRPIHLRSPKVSLTVKDMPADLNGRTWLPAKELILKETWSKDTENLEMGEPLTRTIVIYAKGLRGEQLPELALPDHETIKIYPDKAQTNTAFDGTWVVGTREEKYAMVPTRPGSVTIPGIHIPWWNIETGQWEDAQLPARTMTVRGASLSESTPHLSPARAQGQADPLSAHDRSPVQVESGNFNLPISHEETPIWALMSGVLLGIWVLTLAGWWWDRRGRTHRQTDEARAMGAQATESERKAIQAVKAACLESSAEKTRTALLKWASLKQQGKPCLSLGTAARMLAVPVPNHADLEKAIWNLDRTLYTTTEPQAWDGQRFWKTIQPVMTAKPPKIKNNNESLPELYLH
jgi:hypothetical protein